MLANDATNFEPVAFWCAQVADDGSGSVFLDHLQACLAIFGFKNAPALTGQALGNESAGKRVVVDQDEGFHSFALFVRRIQNRLPPSGRES